MTDCCQRNFRFFLNEKMNNLFRKLEFLSNLWRKLQIALPEHEKIFLEVLWKLPEKSAVFSWDSGLHKIFFDFHLQFCA